METLATVRSASYAGRTVHVLIRLSDFDSFHLAVYRQVQLDRGSGKGKTCGIAELSDAGVKAVMNSAVVLV